MILVKIINNSGYSLPNYASVGAAGIDIRAVLPTNLTLLALERKLIPTGLFVEIPPGYEMQIRPRSGLALKKGLTVLNTPGTIDSDYRGEIMVLMVNFSNQSQIIQPAERIAQLILAKYETIQWQEVESLSDSLRQKKGYGSTGEF